jgi:hypothetical protein
MGWMLQGGTGHRDREAQADMMPGGVLHGLKELLASVEEPDALAKVRLLAACADDSKSTAVQAWMIHLALSRTCVRCFGPGFDLCACSSNAASHKWIVTSASQHVQHVQHRFSVCNYAAHELCENNPDMASEMQGFDQVNAHLLDMHVDVTLEGAGTK